MTLDIVSLEVNFESHCPSGSMGHGTPVYVSSQGRDNTVFILTNILTTPSVNCILLTGASISTGRKFCLPSR